MRVLVNSFMSASGYLFHLSGTTLSLKLRIQGLKPTDSGSREILRPEELVHANSAYTCVKMIFFCDAGQKLNTQNCCSKPVRLLAVRGSSVGATKTAHNAIL
jgi:hypothetical protein